MANSKLTTTALDNQNNSNVLNPNWVPLNSTYLYNFQNVPVSSEKINFYITLEDGTGSPVDYVLKTRSIVNRDPSADSLPNAIEYETVTKYIRGLILSINPNSISVNLSKIINRTPTMVGWIEEHWGEELDTITFQGSSASFIYKGNIPGSAAGSTPILQTDNQIRQYFDTYVDLPDISTGGPSLLGGFSGLTAIMRRETAGYQEFKKIIEIMNGNGAIFDIRGFVKDRVYVVLSYDYAQYIGYFESVDTTEDSANPFRFTYTITFKAERTIYSFSSKG